MAAHARLGPSNHRWPHCAGSVEMESGYPDIPGDAAIDGTGSHLLLEMCLINGVRAEHYDQQVIGVNDRDQPNGWLVAPDRIARVQMCLDYVDRQVKELKKQYPGDTVVVTAEEKSDPGGAFGRSDWWGTCDITITVHLNGDCKFIEAIDYKDGRGWVHVPGNTQLLGYLFGQMRHYVGSGPGKVRPFHPGRVPNCRMTIVQPKTNPVIRYVCSTRTDDNFSTQYVIDQADIMGTAAYRTDKKDAPLTAGKHCQWCRANPKRGGHCTADAEKSLQVVESMSTELIATDSGGSLFEQVHKMVADPTGLTVEQLGELASAKDALIAAFSKVEEEIEVRIDRGEKVPGWAMLPGRGSNVWSSDEETIVKALKGRRLKNVDIYPPKLISPAQVMKLNSLTDAQKTKIEKDHIAFKAGGKSLKKVAHDHVEKVEKDVVQCTTDEVNSAELMFRDVPTSHGSSAMFTEQVETTTNVAEEVTFF